MARKPREQWSAAYRKRIESAERRGLSRQEARGHKPRAGRSEHQQRQERRIAKLSQGTSRDLVADVILTLGLARAVKFFELQRKAYEEYRGYGPDVEMYFSQMIDLVEDSPNIKRVVWQTVPRHGRNLVAINSTDSEHHGWFFYH